MKFKSKTPALVFVLFFTSFAIGQTSPKTTTADDRTKQQILEMHRKLNEASLRNDVETADRLTSDDFIALGPDGKRIANKASILTMMEGGQIAVRRLRDIGLTVRIEEGKAIVSGQTIVRMEREGRKFDMRYRFADVWEQREGQWQVVLSRLTKLISISLVK
jgi:ketosteroid isomerase-like protein